MSSTVQCSCGDHSKHTIAKRKTADGLLVALWDDGALTSSLGYPIDGVPFTRARKSESVSRQLSIGWLFASWVELYSREELGELYAACVVAVDHELSLQEARQLIKSRKENSTPKLKWEHSTSGDYVAHLPRMLGFSRLGDVVLRSRGEFHLMRVGNGSTGSNAALFSTGWKSSSLAGLFRQMRASVAS